MCVSVFQKWNCRLFMCSCFFFSFLSLSSSFYRLAAAAVIIVVFLVHFVCVRFAIQTKQTTERTQNDFSLKSWTNDWTSQLASELVRRKKLLRESRLTWKNSSRNIWIEICTNWCECECDVLNRLKLQLVQSLKTYSKYVLFVFTIIQCTASWFGECVSVYYSLLRLQSSRRYLNLLCAIWIFGNNEKRENPRIQRLQNRSNYAQPY